IMPFLSEEVWQAVVAEGWGTNRPARFPASIMVAEYPRPLEALRDDDAEREMDRLMALVRAVRNLRSELNLPPSRRLAAEVFARDAAARQRLEAESPLIAQLARVEPLTFVDTPARPPEVPSGAARWRPERRIPPQIPSGTTRGSRYSSIWRSRRMSAAATGLLKRSCLLVRVPAPHFTRSNVSLSAACRSSIASSAR